MIGDWKTAREERQNRKMADNNRGVWGTRVRTWLKCTHWVAMASDRWARAWGAWCRGRPPPGWRGRCGTVQREPCTPMTRLTSCPSLSAAARIDVGQHALALPIETIGITATLDNKDTPWRYRWNSSSRISRGAISRWSYIREVDASIAQIHSVCFNREQLNEPEKHKHFI